MAHVKYTGSGHLVERAGNGQGSLEEAFPGSDGGKTADWLMAPATIEAGRRNAGTAGGGEAVEAGIDCRPTLVKKREELAAAIAEASKYDDEVMIERFVPGRELTVGVLGDDRVAGWRDHPQARDLRLRVQVHRGHGEGRVSQRSCRAEATERVQQQALAAFRALKLRGYARALISG